jgi:hypothetical protein
MSEIMKPRRKMLLCVTATSMVAFVACDPSAHPVGMVAPHSYGPQDAAPTETSDDGGAEGATATVETAQPVASATRRDAGFVGKVAVPVGTHRVGTTAEGPEDYAPVVGTTARAPDAKK